MAKKPDTMSLAANTVRMLVADAVERAQSGHPGMPMGAADYATVLWARFLKHNPADPAWPNRDRFVLSAGHGSMLLYALLHLSGYDLPIEELQRFRQWGSATPGHPEVHETPGVETTTGPLGQGFANGVGMAIAAKMTQARYNTADAPLFDHYVYGIVSDGDLMEGVTAEAASLAGHLKLGNLIYFYDDNAITIEGSTSLAFGEDRAKRFEAYGWQVMQIDGHDFAAIEAAILSAQAETDRPSLIVAKTNIGWGSPSKANTAESHGAPLGAAELAATKANLGWPAEPAFYVPEEVTTLYAARRQDLQAEYAAWQERFAAWKSANPDLADAWARAQEGDLPDDLAEQLLQALPAKTNATRRLSGAVLQRAGELVPYLVGGSADLSPSTNTIMEAYESIAPASFSGRNFHFGVREHAMGSVMNGIALYGGFKVYGATFLVFADYMRPSIRLASIMRLPVVYVFTHDSIFVGEDGPTHQPVEQIASLRLIPGVTVIRPADGPEVAAAWSRALYRTRGEGPTALILTRQSVPDIPRQTPFSFNAFNRGAYVVAETAGREPDVVLVGTGSELHLAVKAQQTLEAAGYAARAVSMPSREIFMRQNAEYRQSLLPAGAKKVVIEAGTRFGWGDVVGNDALMITQDRFGHSAPYEVLAKELHFNEEDVNARVLAFAAQ